jgi:antitoxin HigA-1
MAPVVHPGRRLKPEMVARHLSANRLALDVGVPSGRITDILNGRRAITADTAVRLGRYFADSAEFWLGLQSQYCTDVVERERARDCPARKASRRGLILACNLRLRRRGYSAASLAPPPLFPGFPAFFSTGAKNFPV